MNYALSSVFKKCYKVTGKEVSQELCSPSH